MRKLMMLIVSLMISAAGRADVFPVQGVVYGVITADTLLILDDAVIPFGEVLEIKPGAVVWFDGFYFIQVDGSFIAPGTAQQSILFTVADTLGFSDTLEMRGAWHGLRFFGDHPEAVSSFSWCVFEYTKALDLDSLSNYGGAVHGSGKRSATFTHCTFRKNTAWHRGGAVALRNGADFVFDNCIFSGNTTYNPDAGYGGALYAEYADPVIRNCTFSYNQAVWTGGGACFYYSNPWIHNNIFTGNFGYIGGGMAFYHCRPVRTICNNLVYANTGLYFGGGISCNNASDPVLVNNTIVQNQATYGGGFYCNDSAAPAVYNSLIYNNISFSGLGPVYIWDVHSHPNFHYCNIQGGKEAFAGSGGGVGYWGVYENNYDEVPVFDPGSTYPFYPYDGSLIDRGTPVTDTAGLKLPSTDLSGGPRVYGPLLDVGAYEWWNVGLVDNKISIPELSVMCNPGNSKVRFSAVLPESGSYRFQILDMAGKKVFSTVLNQDRGPWFLEWHTEHLPSGSYVALLKGNVQTATVLFRKI